MIVRTWLGYLKTLVIGKARSFSDERLFHKVSLVAVLAWVGLGADGVSSSCYGPEEAFKSLGMHVALAPFIAMAIIATIAVLCTSYSQIIELFPGGGGGYLVASKLLSPGAGVVSGCALLVDYVLTIALSIASGADALFSVVPPEWHMWKLAVAASGVWVLTVLNLRGVKESVMVWVPVFLVFLATHWFGVAFALGTHVTALPQVVADTTNDLAATHSQLGWLGVLLLLARAYSMGAGTYTGIEAVSNGLPILREPRVATGKRTMTYIGLSLGITVGGLLLAYLLYRVSPQEGKTLNAVLFERMTADWPPVLAKTFVMAAMISAMAILFVAAQTGFLDGPRVLANMALDRWAPVRFATLSDRLVTKNGILLMGGAAMAVLLMARGSVSMLVVLYSINVFITFSLSQLGMVRHWWTNRTKGLPWRHKLTVNFVGLCLTVSILVSLSIVKFWEGGWITLLVTGLLATAAFLIQRHYRRTTEDLARLDKLAAAVADECARLPDPPADQNAKCDPRAKTAVLFVNGFNGLGVHTLLGILKMFPDVFRNFVFIQVGVVDAGNFKGADEIEHLQHHIAEQAGRYALYMRRYGHCAESITRIGTDVVDMAAELAVATAQRFPNSVFFGGQLVFASESWVTRLLHNYVVFALQRRLFRSGMPFLILPVRV